MRRSDKEVTDRKAVDWIVRQAQVCHLAMSRDDRPYVVPLSFGYDGEHIYFHSAQEGTKIDIFTANPHVCFEFEHEVQLVSMAEQACGWSFSFYSVVGSGVIRELTDIDDKTAGLNHVMEHYSGRSWQLPIERVNAVRVWRVDIDEMTGKQSKDKIS